MTTNRWRAVLFVAIVSAASVSASAQRLACSPATRPGWRACVPSEGPRPASVTATLAAAAGAIDRIDSAYFSWVFLVLLIALAIHNTDHYVSERRDVVRLLAAFGEAFVREFDRPLVRAAPSDRVIDSRLRFSPHRWRVDVLLAPRAGRLYPNLADHRKNVEYDVWRVLRAMNDPPFVQEPMYMQGRWVVVPFQLKANPGQAGGR
ncbi:MAG TPA: hypothetical protein VN654_17535 [Vicinamibacterales bacterium]|nr:hypothetical protein [Vicinamibacterales bacterium]